MASAWRRVVNGDAVAVMTRPAPAVPLGDEAPLQDQQEVDMLISAFQVAKKNLVAAVNREEVLVAKHDKIIATHAADLKAARQRLEAALEEKASLQEKVDLLMEERDSLVRSKSGEKALI